MLGPSRHQAARTDADLESVAAGSPASGQCDKPAVEHEPMGGRPGCERR